MIDPLDTEANDAKRKQEADRIRLAQLTEVEDYKWLMSTKRGRRIVFRLLHQAGVNRSVFHTNALQMSYNEGHRAMGLFIQEPLLLHCPDRYAEMMDEANK